MIKLVYCFKKKPDMSYEEFFHYWKNIHGPMASRISGLRKLVQSHLILKTNEIRSPDFDGMAELWFDDMETLLAARKTPEFRALSADETNFIDSNHVAFFITEEHEIF